MFEKQSCQFKRTSSNWQNCSTSFLYEVVKEQESKYSDWFSTNSQYPSQYHGPTEVEFQYSYSSASEFKQRKDLYLTLDKDPSSWLIFKKEIFDTEMDVSDLDQKHPFEHFPLGLISMEFMELSKMFEFQRNTVFLFQIEREHKVIFGQVCWFQIKPHLPHNIFLITQSLFFSFQVSLIVAAYFVRGNAFSYKSCGSILCHSFHTISAERGIEGYSITQIDHAVFVSLYKSQLNTSGVSLIIRKSDVLDYFAKERANGQIDSYFQKFSNGKEDQVYVVFMPSNPERSFLVFFRRSGLDKDANNKKMIPLSWTEAAEACHSRGGHLPIIRSMEEVFDLISINLQTHADAITSLIFLGRSPHNDGYWVNRDPVAFQLKAFDRTPEKIYSHLSTKDKSAQRADKVKTYREYSYSHEQGNCTALSVTNLVLPFWLQINCTDKLSNRIICIKNDTENSALINPNSSHEMCSKTEILHSSTCFNFKWYEKPFSTQICEKNPSRSFQYLFEAVDASNWPPIIASETSAVSFLKYFDQLLYQSSVLPAEGFCILSKKRHSWSKTENVFKCKDGSYICALFVCDTEHDCPDQSDEQMCSIQDVLESVFESLTSTKHHFQKCFLLLNLTATGQCKVFENYHIKVLADPEQTKTNNSLIEAGKYLCENGQVVSRQQVNDLVEDCKPHGEDESLLKEIIQNISYFSCAEKNQIPCRNGHPKCFNVSQICSLTFTTTGHLSPCRTGEHLQKCEVFECNSFFKCPHFYCIPWAYTCDGKWDCPGGHDENMIHGCRFNSRSCKHLFKCKKSTICTHLKSICDGHSDCPLNDDENLCDVSNIVCPFNCKCLTVALYCSNISPQGNNFVSFRVIYFEKSKAGEQSFLKVQHLFFVDSDLSDIILLTDLPKNSNIKILSVQMNQIVEIANDVFQNAFRLLSLELGVNLITKITTNSFDGLISLVTLNLSNNPLLSLFYDDLVPLTSLKMISLRQTNKLRFHSDLFDETKLIFIEVTDVMVCCVAPPGSECSISIPWYISCTDLLPYEAIKAMFYVITCLIFASNAASLTLVKISIKQIRKPEVFSVVLCAVNVVDISLSIPFSILFTVDLVNEGKFASHFSSWCVSPGCQTVFGFLLNFHLVSPLTLIFAAIARLRVVQKPLDSKFKRGSFLQRWIFILILGSFAFSVIVSFSSWLIEINVYRNSFSIPICSPFADPSKTIVFVKVVTWIVFLLQLSVSVAITVIHLNIVKELQQNMQNVEASVSVKKSGTPVVVQLLATTISNILSWIPCNIVFVTSMFVNEYSLEMILWTTVAVGSINSLVNPCLVIVSTSRKMHATRNWVVFWNN